MSYRRREVESVSKSFYLVQLFYDLNYFGINANFKTVSPQRWKQFNCKIHSCLIIYKYGMDAGDVTGSVSVVNFPLLVCLTTKFSF